MAQAVPFWNVNVPREQWTAECPAFLAGLDQGDQAQLGTRDEDYPLMSWQDVSKIIHENRLQDFKRVPSQLHKYRKYIADVKREHGSIMNYILKERVHWANLTPNGAPFTNPDDLRITYNDWPYGIDPKIVHLVVWVKFGFEEDMQTGDLTPAARRLIDDYVEKEFRSAVGKDHVLWFKNWSALKSVHAIEHFHVMLYNPDVAFVSRITQGDVPASQRNTEIRKTRD